MTSNSAYRGLNLGSCILSIFLMLAVPASVFSQNPLKKSIRFTTASTDLSDALIQLSQQSGVTIFFSGDLTAGEKVGIYDDEGTLDEILTELLRGKGIYYKKLQGQIILKKAIREGQKYTVSGFIKDRNSGERLISASVYDYVTGRGITTNEYGFYSLTLPSGELDLISQYIGFDEASIRFSLKRDTTINFGLIPQELPEIIVRPDSNLNQLINLPLGEDVIDQTDLSFSPMLGGEAEIYRALELLPGINTGTDGVGGIHVRGGNSDQNLILMDGVPIYNPSHLVGIFSVFNPDAISQVDIYKANFPARYGGRLSSVMDVHTKEGNDRDFEAGVRVGVASANLRFEGPIIKGKSSFLLTGRWFVPSLFIRDISAKYKETQQYSGSTFLNFNDLNAKVNFEFDRKNRLYFSYYQGKDVFEDITKATDVLTETISIGGEETEVTLFYIQKFNKSVNWGNRVAIGRWNHQLSDKIFVNTSFSYSKYRLQSVDQNNFLFRYSDPVRDTLSGFDNQEFSTSIEDFSLRTQFDFLPNLNHRIKWGLQATKRNFLPKSITFNEQSKINDFFIEEGLISDALFSEFEITAFEFAAFLEDDWTIIDDLIYLNAGVHTGAFYVENKLYVDPQIRTLLRFNPLHNLSLQAGVSQMTQYLHLLTNSNIGLPTDLWVPATSNIKPQESIQYSAGIIYRPWNGVTFKLEAYQKEMKNLINFQEGASFLLPEGPLATSILDAGNWEEKVTSGEGLSQGIEFTFKGDFGSVISQLSYSYAESERTFEELNFGESFPYRYNQKHTGSITLGWKPGKRITLRANWLYGSGNHITLAESKFSHPGDIFPEVGLVFGTRNGYKMPDYHRLDLGLDWRLGDLNKKWQQSIHFDVYNVYNRENPFYVSLVEDQIEGNFSFKQFSIFRILPSIAYSLVLK